MVSQNLDNQEPTDHNEYIHSEEYYFDVWRDYHEGKN